MTGARVSWLNGGAALLALATSIGAAALAGHRPAARAATATAPAGAENPATVTDASGYPVAVRPFRRIAAGSTVADRLLLDLAEPQRIVALTEFGQRHSLVGYRYGDRLLIKSLDDTESLLALKADLLLVNNYGDQARVARLRESGLAVFDLGEMRGTATLLPNIRAVAALLGDSARGAAYERALLQRLERVAAPLAGQSRRRAMYVSIYGDRLFGGTAGTNYHDILTFAGLDDVAAAHFQGWPQYGAEDLLTLDPPLVVTRPGMRRLLCGQPELDRLRACAAADGFVEIPGALLDDPGPALLDAAEAVFAAAYPDVGKPSRR
ncbi:MAG TPA: ABC transporter substrate-binding protein [Polyangia bacterium]|jgi:iron complex transport system substrate-binding protein